CCDRMELEELPAQLDRLRLLVTVGEASWPEDVRRRVAAWVEAGGAWLSTGGRCGMGELLGVEAVPPAFALWGGALPVLGEGFLDARGSPHPVLQGLPLPLHFFNGIAVTAGGGDALATMLDAHHRP